MTPNSKTYLNTFVYRLADQHGLEYATVHRIISNYIDYCKEKLMQGQSVEFFGLATVELYRLQSSKHTTLAYDCYMVAHKMGLPSMTVYYIIEAYLQELRTDILHKHKPVNIRGILSIKPRVSSDGELATIHSSISNTLKDELLSVNESARVKTSHYLRGFY